MHLKTYLSSSGFLNNQILVSHAFDNHFLGRFHTGQFSTSACQQPEAVLFYEKHSVLSEADVRLTKFKYFYHSTVTFISYLKTYQFQNTSLQTQKFCPDEYKHTCLNLTNKMICSIKKKLLHINQLNQMLEDSIRVIPLKLKKISDERTPHPYQGPCQNEAHMSLRRMASSFTMEKKVREVALLW